MDYMLLSLVKRLLLLSASWKRLSLAALLGAGWACADLLLPGKPVWAEFFLTWLFAGTAMVLTAFGWREPLWKQKGISSIRHVGTCTAAFWMVSAMAGGILSALGDQTAVGYYLSGTRAVRQWSLVPLCFWAAGIYFCFCAFVKILQKKVKQQEKYVTVKLSYGGREKVVTALWDTGNQLYEPYGGQPVHVITSQVCRQLCRTVPSLIYIPFRTVGTEYGMMPGIRVDFMEVEKEGKVIRRYEHPWLAISKRPLSFANQYEMLLHGEEL